MKNTTSSTEDVLVILPGLLCDSRMFAAQLDALPGSQVIDEFYGGSRTIGGMADYALERLPSRCALLGHSMGARVALEILRKAPGRITRLLLSDTGIHPVKPGEAEKRYALRELGRTQGFAALVDNWLPPMMAEASRNDRKLMERLRAMCLSAGQEIFEAQIEALLTRPILDDLLPRVHCPTLVTVGELDSWSPVDQHRLIAAAIPNAELRVIPEAGHMLPVEAPIAFNRCIGDWLHRP
jgi:pimeloyl-ACP methyl ester carboxylesterase